MSHAPEVVNLNNIASRLASIPWLPHDSAGRQGALIHRLYQSDSSGQQVALVRFAPGSRAPTHLHHGHESILVLDGAYQDETGCYGSGDLVVYPDGSSHSWSSPGGALLYVVWGGKVQVTGDLE